MCTIKYKHVYKFANTFGPCHLWTLSPLKWNIKSFILAVSQMATKTGRAWLGQYAVKFQIYFTFIFIFTEIFHKFWCFHIIYFNIFLRLWKFCNGWNITRVSSRSKTSIFIYTCLFFLLSLFHSLFSFSREIGSVGTIWVKNWARNKVAKRKPL